MSVVKVRLADARAADYDILIEPGCFARLGTTVAGWAPAPTAAIVSDSNVAALHGRAALDSLRAAGYTAELLTFPAGEEHKHLGTCQLLWDGLAGMRTERASPVVALGGGVTGDVAGFVAAAYLRGLPVVQVPTTLLAAVDSSVGGKTGVNHPVAGKNIIGAFHQPVGVVIDPLLLATLGRREWACGLAESVKHGVIRDAAFFAWIEQRAGELSDLAAHADRRLPDAADTVVELIEANCRIKAAVVSADEREAGLRAILNFGHTVGHALEAVGRYDLLRHGEAVSIGMVVESRLALSRGLIDASLLDRLIALLAALGLPVHVPDAIATTDAVGLLHKDKKVKAGRVRYVLPTGLGATTIVADVTSEQVSAAIDASRAD
ncbi:MAG: 3-dehydroquinate synthase [Phycisphaerae bacterium]|nr:3-dehydroquinate synthase [Phycisphaerae bacterium]